MLKNIVKNPSVVWKVPKWISLTLNEVSDYYSTPKPIILRGCIDACARMEDLPLPQTHQLEFLDKNVLIHYHLSNQDLGTLAFWENKLKRSKKEIISGIIIAGLPKMIERMEAGTPIADRLDRNVLKFLRIPHELVDSVYDLRNEHGLSPSLLLREAVLGWRKRVLPKIPNYRNPRGVSFRMLPQEWERLEILATSSEMEIKKAVSSLLMHYYFQK